METSHTTTSHEARRAALLQRLSAAAYQHARISLDLASDPGLGAEARALHTRIAVRAQTQAAEDARYARQWLGLWLTPEVEP